jgi:hypothetical protein
MSVPPPLGLPNLKLPAPYQTAPFAPPRTFDLRLWSFVRVRRGRDEDYASTILNSLPPRREFFPSRMSLSPP